MQNTVSPAHVDTPVRPPRLSGGGLELRYSACHPALVCSEQVRTHMILVCRQSGGHGLSQRPDCERSMYVGMMAVLRKQDYPLVDPATYSI
jgi:hypothetical protein